MLDDHKALPGKKMDKAQKAKENAGQAETGRQATGRRKSDFDQLRPQRRRDLASVPKKVG